MSNPSSSRPLTGHLSRSLCFCLFVAGPDGDSSQWQIAGTVSFHDRDRPSKSYVFPFGDLRVMADPRCRSNSCSLTTRSTLVFSSLPSVVFFNLVCISLITKSVSLLSGNLGIRVFGNFEIWKIACSTCLHY